LHGPWNKEGLILLQYLKKLSSPPVFFSAAGKSSVWLLSLGAFIFTVGAYLALFKTPTDAVQGEVYRAIYVHVPTAWMSMFLYTVATGYAVLHWVYKTDVSAVMMRAFLPTGALMTFVALVTGALWGRPTWGTYWVWDARLTSELLLLFIYLGLMALNGLVDDDTKVDRVMAVAMVVGLANIPLIYFSVIYWNTLHQGMTFGSGGNRMAPEMRQALLACVFGIWFLCAGLVLKRARWMLVSRCENSQWVKGVLA
jgi:heme exporter protein C